MEGGCKIMRVGGGGREGARSGKEDIMQDYVL